MEALLRETERVVAEIERLQSETFETARTGCEIVDALMREPTPARLQTAQDWIRVGLIGIRDQLAPRKKRSRKRSDAKQDGNDPPEVKRGRGELRALLKNRDGVLQHQARVLREIGDGCAWTILRQDGKLISALFHRERTQTFSSGIGLAGPAQVMREAHATGEFFVLENDLTRCIGYGDLTVTAVDGRWVRPLLIEIKSEGELIEGATMGLNFISVITNHPLDAELFARFRSKVGLLDVQDPPPLQKRARKQADELLERQQLLVNLSARQATVIGPSSINLWPVIRTVLSRATQTRYAFDLADSEIVFIAVRNGPLEQVTKDVKKVSQLVTDYGLRTPNKTRFVMSSLDFHKSPVLSALVPPIALWPLDVDLRARLLSNDLMLRCEYDADIWDKVFEQYGMRLSASEGAWVISRGTHRLHFGRVDVRRIRDSVGLGGLSPSALAKRLSDEIDRTN